MAINNSMYNFLSPYEGTLPEKKYKFFGSKGFTGILAERESRFRAVNSLQTYKDYADYLNSTTYFLQEGVLADAVAQLIDTSGFTTGSGTITFNKSSITIGGSSRATLVGDSYTGNYWMQTVTTSADSTYRPRFLSPTYAPESTRQSAGPQVWKFPTTASTTLDVLTGVGDGIELDAIQVTEMTDTLANPCDVYVAMGQSLMASSTSSVGTNNELDGWHDKRLLYIPGRTYSAFGMTRGEVHALTVPMQHGSNDIGVSNGIGVSPAHAFGKEMLASLGAGRNIVIIAAAISGTGLTAADAPWNSDGSDPYAYDNAVTLTNDAMAALPVGSTLKGVLWAQGEADTSVDMSNYAPAFAAMRSDFETAVHGGVQLPWVIIAGPPNATRNNQAHFIQTQLDMDADSGEASSQALVYTVERPIAVMEDSTHPGPVNQREAGKIAALRMMEVQ